MMQTYPISRRQQSGMMLLEGLIAILIFSLGILALVGMQATSVKQVTDAKYRSEASMLASQLFGTMWTNDRTAANLKAKFDTTAGTSDALTNWKVGVSNTLPGITISNNQPTVNVSALGDSSDGTVTVSIYWAAPSDATNTPHKYVTVAQIK